MSTNIHLYLRMVLYFFSQYPSDLSVRYPLQKKNKMFTKLFVFAAFIAALTAQENADKQPVEIITERTLVKPDGYDFEYKTSDGVSRREEGTLITVGDQQGIGVKGSYSYTAPDGQQYQVTFTADDKGYKPQIHILPSQ
ncbi:flexible cuticle protein 12-like [Amyelois transitella]|uniref:flexible cuticle protein 12-like n=1 Tax=Amyelois transitella TaxID=680683 RepID=UPI00298FFA21|nr:flexible cuticle protein 12-like [Amyelois transitella]